jgi:UDP-3-O-[3-hydroxymyristoyl] glucosamine N-acyltransferase
MIYPTLHSGPNSMENKLMPESHAPQLPSPPVSLSELAACTPGAKAFGDTGIQVVDLAHPRMVSGPDQMMLILDAAALSLIPQSPFPVKAAVIAQGIEVPSGLLEGYITVERPRFALATLLSVFKKPLHATSGIHPSAIVEAGAQVHPTASVGAFVYVGPQAKVGANVVLMPHVTVGAQAMLDEGCIVHAGACIGERVMLGKRVIIHHNASIGADGFSYVTPEPGSIESAKASGGKITGQNSEIIKINSIGTVVLEDNVEVGACTTIDRANLGATIIKKGSKIDNLVMIAHNNQIGENCLIASQTGVAGSCEIGDRVVMAGQVGVADHLKVGNDAILMAKTGLIRDVEEKTVLMGYPGMPKRQAFQNYMYINKLKDIFQEMKVLQRRVAELEAMSKSLVEV